MNMLKWLLYLLLSCLACSKLPTTPNPVVAEGPYQVTATLNDSTWFGAAQASKSVSLTGESTCTSNRYDIRFLTDLPLSGTAPKQSVTGGCLRDCTPTQTLVFYRVPSAVGKYSLADLNACATSQGAVVYTLLLGGDAVVNAYTSQSTSTGWLQVTAYDERQTVIEGSFEIDLLDRMGKSARFKKGVFKAQIK